MQRNFVTSLALGVCVALGLAFPGTASSQSTNPPEQATKPNQANPGYNWKGLYAGANLGLSRGTFQDPVQIAATSALPSSSVSYNVSSTSFTGGGQAGYNWQRRRLVYGFEGALNLMNLNGTETLTTGIGQLIPGDSFAAHSHWGISLRPRVGYTWDKLLVYATGGLAFAGVYAKSNFIAVTNGGATFPASSGSDTHTLTGGTIGGGVEYAVRGKWRVAGEYRYSGYAHATFDLGNVAVIFVNPGFTNAPSTASMGLRTNEFIVKVNRKF